MSDLPRPKRHLVAAGKLFPSAWAQYDEFRQDRGQGGLPDWPEWCYCPMAGAYAIISGGGSNRVPSDQIGDVARLAALAAWRPSQDRLTRKRFNFKSACGPGISHFVASHLLTLPVPTCTTLPSASSCESFRLVKLRS